MRLTYVSLGIGTASSNAGSKRQSIAGRSDIQTIRARAKAMVALVDLSPAGWASWEHDE